MKLVHRISRVVNAPSGRRERLKARLARDYEAAMTLGRVREEVVTLQIRLAVQYERWLGEVRGRE